MRVLCRLLLKTAQSPMAIGATDAVMVLGRTAEAGTLLAYAFLKKNVENGLLEYCKQHEKL